LRESRFGTLAGAVFAVLLGCALCSREETISAEDCFVTGGARASVGEAVLTGALTTAGRLGGGASGERDVGKGACVVEGVLRIAVSNVALPVGGCGVAPLVGLGAAFFTGFVWRLGADADDEDDVEEDSEDDEDEEERAGRDLGVFLVCDFDGLAPGRETFFVVGDLAEIGTWGGVPESGASAVLTFCEGASVQHSFF
jgi:hypothetical protein